MISHIVLFQPKADLSHGDILLFAQQLRRTMSGVPSVRSARIGRRVDVSSGEPRNFGDMAYEFAAVVDFEDRSGLVDYLRHPLHQALGELFWRYCGSTVITEVEMVDATSPQVTDLLVTSQK